SQASANGLTNPNNMVSGALTAGQVNVLPLTVSETGRLTANVTLSGNSTLVPQLTLIGPNGQVLIQSDAGTIVQHLQAGTYTLTVSAGAGAGSYRLSTDFSAG